MSGNFKVAQSSISINITDWVNSTALVCYSSKQMTINSSVFYFNVKSDLIAGLSLVSTQTLVISNMSYTAIFVQYSLTTNISLLFLNSSGPTLSINRSSCTLYATAQMASIIAKVSSQISI